MATLADLKKLEFMGLPIPISKLRVRGGLRHHIHEYPHVAGGSLEKLGRKLYEVVATCHFDAISLHGRYLNYWPDGINAFRKLFESGETGPLQLPWIGTIDACAVAWDEDFDVKVISGEGVEITWIEDQESQFLIDAIMPTSFSGGFASKLATFDVRAGAIKPPISIFVEIRAVANKILAIRDTAELYTTLVDAKLMELKDLISEADKTVAMLNEPVNHQILEDLHELWAATIELAKDIAQQGEELKSYTTAVLMRIDEIAVAVYGSSERASELMQLNAVEDPYAVPPGTLIRYYEAA